MHALTLLSSKVRGPSILARLASHDWDSMNKVSTRPCRFYHNVYLFITAVSGSVPAKPRSSSQSWPDSELKLDHVLASYAGLSLDCAMWLDGELCGAVGNSNMCWPGPRHTIPQISATQATNCSFSLGIWSYSRDWDKSGPEKFWPVWLVPDHGVSPVIFLLIAISCRSLSPLSPGIS